MAENRLPTCIVKYPDPRLRRVCPLVTEFDDGLAALAERMLKLMREGDGVGLAAPQTGLSCRLFVCNPTGEPGDDHVFINPELVNLTGQAEAEEGCLSLPDIHVVIRRARRCGIRFQDITGKAMEMEAEGLLARIWQHETDHLDGKLIIDRMDATDRIANRKKVAQLEVDYKKAHSGKPARAR